jgi:hypothetical protein
MATRPCSWREPDGQQMSCSVSSSLPARVSATRDLVTCLALSAKTEICTT